MTDYSIPTASLLYWYNHFYLLCAEELQARPTFTAFGTKALHQSNHPSPNASIYAETGKRICVRANQWKFFGIIPIFVYEPFVGRHVSHADPEIRTIASRHACLFDKAGCLPYRVRRWFHGRFRRRNKHRNTVHGGLCRRDKNRHELRRENWSG
jgi:hypothetical protein